MKTERTLTQAKVELAELNDYQRLFYHPKVREVIGQLQKENAPRIAELKAEIAGMRAGKKKPQRWPEGIPQWVVDLCKLYWWGTTELGTFRIHEFNEKAVWTSYPSGGYTNNGGFNPTPPCYRLIARNAAGVGMSGRQRPKVLKELIIERCSGQRVTAKMRLEELEKL